jgi:hypothetical protein
LELETCAFSCGLTVGVPPTAAQTLCVKDCEAKYPAGIAGGPLALFDCVYGTCGASCN